MWFEYEWLPWAQIFVKLSHHGVALLRRIRMCGLIGVDVALLKEVHHWGRGWALSFQKSKPGSVLPVDLHVELSATPPVPCLPACHMITCSDDNGLCL